MKEGKHMADYVMDKDSFAFTYSAKQQSEIENENESWEIHYI